MKYIFALLMTTTILWSKDFYINSRFNQLRVQPENLKLEYKSADSNWITISAPGLKTEYNLIKQAGNLLQWAYPDSGITFKISLAGDKIEVEIINPNAMPLIWPKIVQEPAFKALIWPYGQGLWIPFSKNGNFLNGESLPDNKSEYWGINLKNRTLTFIHNNEINLFHYNSNNLENFEFFQNSVNSKITIFSTLSNSPIEPALKYKKHLEKTGHYSGSKNKLKKSILGAPIFLLEGKEYITGDDLIESKVRVFCQTVIGESKISHSPSFNIKRILLGTKEWDFINETANNKNITENDRSNLAKILSKIITSKEFYLGSINENSSYLYNSFSEFLHPNQNWGAGETLGVLYKLKNMELDNSIILTNSVQNDVMSSHALNLGYKTGLDDVIINDNSEKVFKNSIVIPLNNALNREYFLMATDKTSTREDLVRQLLFMQTPLYHVGKEWSYSEKISNNINIIKDLHKEFGSSKMTGFNYLSDSGLIQRATYEGGLTAVANLSNLDCDYNNKIIPPGAILLTTPDIEIIY